MSDGSDGGDNGGGGYDTIYDAQPIVQSVVIDFELTNLPPKQKFYPYINGKSINNYTKPSGGTFGDDVKTDTYGDATGQIVVPSDTVLNFPAGPLELQFGDSSVKFTYSKAFATAVSSWVIAPG